MPEEEARSATSSSGRSSSRLEVAEQLARLDALGRGFSRDRVTERSPPDAARELATYVYGEQGFRGNEEDYGDPRNSYLNDVLDRRTGIPITLALILLAVARRAGVAAHGISFPGHFLVRIERPSGHPVVIDPFFAGRPLSRDELQRLLRKTAGAQATLRPEHLEPAANRAILVRVLQNLKAAHVQRGDLAHALVAAARVVALLPLDPAAVRDRGLLQAQLGAPEGALADLARYLELSPGAPDAGAVRGILAKLGQRPSARPN